MLSLSLGRLLKRSVGSWEEYDEQGLGMPACWQRLGAAGRALPYSQGTGRAETQSARPHPPGTFVSPRRSWDHLRAAEGAGKITSLHPPRIPHRGREGWKRGWGISLEKEDRVKGLGQEGGQLGAKGREEV